MLACIVLVFTLAALAPALFRLFRGATHWVLGAAVAAITAYFARWVPEVADGRITRIAHEWAPLLGINLSFRADGWSLLFALIISGIGTLIVVYAGGYLKGHAQLGSFYAYLLLFMGSMLGVVLADNVVLLFIFWELTSFSSYLLIGFDHERPAARAAALQALLVTGLGGLALLAGLLLMGIAGGSLELSELLNRGEIIRGHTYYTPVLVLVLLGAATKSAQFPFHFWLPNAMQAPSPVSAYLHSATMVKAGVFLLARLSPILGGTDAWQQSVTALGAMTMVAGAVLSLGCNELKRLLAYSTVSVLGTLTMLIGLGTPYALHAAVMYLLAHALYKGALFMLAGSMAHATGMYDADRLAGLRSAMPLTATAAFLAALSMAGLPPFAGFLGKEALYEALWIGEGLALLLLAAAVVSHMLLLVVALRVGVRPFLGRTSTAPPAAHEVAFALCIGPLAAGAVGVAAGFSASSVGTYLVSPAVAAVRGSASDPISLALWHGLTPALGLSALTLLGGLALFALRRPLTRILAPVGSLSRSGPAAWYDAALLALNVVAKGQTRILQSGYLRTYLLITLGTAVALVGYPLLIRAETINLLTASDVLIHEVVVAALILIAAVAAVRARSRLGAIAALGVVGYGVSLIYVFFGAPDLAMTQILIETLIVILFVLVFYYLPPFAVLTTPAARVRDLVVAGAFGALMTFLILAAGAIQSHPRISSYFAEHSVPEAHGRNVVNVILVDFRAMDTLGEITVLAIAAVGVYALVRFRKDREGGAP